MRSIRTVLLVVMMSFLCVCQLGGKPVEVHAGTDPSVEMASLTPSGSGTPADPWRIYTLAQLAQLSIINTFPNHPLADDYFIMMNDLDFSDANNDGIKDDPFVAPGSPSVTSNWSAIGAIEPEHRFTGNFDGQSHQITGLTISTSLDNQGLFGVLGYGAVIHDLDLIEVSIEGGIAVGGIAGRIIQNVLVHNVSTSGVISATSMIDSQVGGIIGVIENSATLRNVHSSAHVFAINGAVGGLVGYVFASTSSSVINAYFNGVINTLNTSNHRGVGGFFGVVNSGQVITLQNALYYGNAYDSNMVGYFVGANSNPSLTLDRVYFVPSTSFFMSDLGFGSWPYLRTNVGVLNDAYTVTQSLMGWINLQSNPALYLAWDYDPAINNGYPFLDSALSTSKGPSLYPGYGTSVIVDPLLSLHQREIPISFTVTIMNPQEGDTLNFVNDGSYALISSLGSLTLFGVIADLSAYQTALRSITFSTTANPGVRVIRFTSATDIYYSSALKSIIVPQATLSYDGNGNTSGTVSSAWTGLARRTVTIEGNSAALSKTGHTFAGWSDGTVTYAEGESIVVSNDTTLSALWSKNSYEVVFKDHDDHILKTQNVLCEAAASAPTNPTRSGYHFIGWDKTFDTITGNLTVNANYEAIGYSLVDQASQLDPILPNFADAVDFSTLELDPTHSLAVKLVFGLRSSTSLTETEKVKLDAYLATLGSAKTIPSFLFDISLSKLINQQEVLVTSSNRPIVITITVPEAFRAVSFKLLRLHTDGEGTTTLVSIPYTYDPLTFKATFSSDQFSVFGFAYGQTALPDTGESNNALGWSALGLSIILGMVSIKRRQKSK